MKCDFVEIGNGKVKCKTHNQTLLYIIYGKLICSSGEDEMVSKLGNLDNYHKFMQDKNMSH